MKFNLIIILLYVIGFFVSGAVQAQPQLPQQEIQILFPDQAAVVDGQLINPTRGLVIKNIDGVISTDVFDVSEITGLTIPDNTAVTGFTAVNDGGMTTSAASYLFSLSTSAGNYVRGDVIECELNGCELFDSFGMNATISSLDYINRVNDLYVSFDTSFEVDNNWIEVSDVYSANDFAVVFDASANGLNDNNAISAFDTSESSITFSALRMAVLPDGLVRPAEVYSSTLFPGNDVLDELAGEVSAINAYYSADTGWLEFDQSVINVSENAGTVSFDIVREGGLENDQTLVVRDIDGTAIDGVDYNGVFSQYFFRDSETLNLSVTIDLIDNSLIDGTKTFTVELGERNNAFVFSLINPNKNSITINIIDDDSDLIFADGFE